MILHSKPTIDQSDIESVSRVLNSGHLEDGTNVEELEQLFCSRFHKKYAVAVSSGFASILLSLKALGISFNHEVIIPSYTCPALLNPIRLLGAIPVLADVEENSFNISYESITQLVSKRTKAIIVPHTFGFPAKIDKIKGFGIPVIEDCAQALGGTYKNSKLGTLGDLAVFSFYATKMIASGDGGMIVTDNEEYFRLMQDYRYYGHRKGHNAVAYNFHLTNLPAALAISQLGKLDWFVQRRKELASLYDSLLTSEVGISNQFVNKNSSCYYRYPIRVSDAEMVVMKMKEHDIGCGYGILEGMHQLLGIDKKQFPNTEYNLKTIVSIPIYPLLTEEEVHEVVRALKQIL